MLKGALQVGFLARDCDKGIGELNLNGSHFVAMSWVRARWRGLVGRLRGFWISGCMYWKERNVFIRGMEVEKGSK